MASTIARKLAEFAAKLSLPIPISLGGTGVATADAARAALGVPGRNRVINGDCRVAQRPSMAYTTGVAAYSGPDRFYAVNSGAGGQFTQSQGTLADGTVTKNCVTQTVNTALADYSTNKYWTGIIQLFEGFNVHDLMGQPISISFLFKASIAGTYSMAVRDAAGTNSYVATFIVAANVVTKVSINVPALPAGFSIPLSASAGLTLTIGAQNGASLSTSTLNTWLAGNFLTSSTASLWATTVGANISVTDLQLELGTAATPFERRNAALELMLCQRYFQTGTALLAGYTGAGVNNFYSHRLAPTMRVTPTLVYDGVAQTNCGVYDIRNPSPNTFLVFTQGAAVGGFSFSCTWYASSEL